MIDQNHDWTPNLACQLGLALHITANSLAQYL
jgi:hypothetical protein